MNSHSSPKIHLKKYDGLTGLMDSLDIIIRALVYYIGIEIVADEAVVDQVEFTIHIHVSTGCTGINLGMIRMIM